MTLAFGAGCLGGVAMSLVEWKLGRMGVAGAFGVKIAPMLTVAWLYPKVVWCGLLGFLFAIPVLRCSVLIRGFFYGFAAALVELFIILPSKPWAGILGLKLGGFTPLFVIFFYLVWGLATAFWLRLVRV